MAEPDTNGMVSAAAAPSATSGPHRRGSLKSGMKSVASSSSLANVASSGSLGQSPHPRGGSSSSSLQAVTALLSSASLEATPPCNGESGKLPVGKQPGGPQGEAAAAEASRSGSCGQGSGGGAEGTGAGKWPWAP